MIIEMDFVSDFKEKIIKDMTAEGLKFSNTLSKDLLIIRYFTYLRKKGGQASRSRKVHKSKEFVCPPELETGLAQMIQVIENGQDLTPFLSTKIDNISFLDGMFNEWGVLHLHLGDSPYSKDQRFVARTGPLVFLYLLEQDAYLINVYDHGDWTKKSILQIINDNWPHLTEHLIIRDAKLSYEWTEEQHLDLRNHGMTGFIQIKNHIGEDIVMGPPGMGITASCDAMIDVREYNNETNAIRRIERYVLENQIELFAPIKERIKLPIRLKLVNENNQWSVIEQSTGEKLNIRK